MKRMAKVAVVLVLAVALCQSAMAAPTQGAYRSTTNSGNHYGLLNQFFGLLGAIWGGNGGHAAIWGGDSGRSTNGAIWGCGGRC